MSVQCTYISDDKKLVVAGEREHAIALYMACKYLPPQLLASPGERKGMLIEASTLLEKIGDRKSLEACSKLMRSFGAASVQGNQFALKFASSRHC